MEKSWVTALVKQQRGTEGCAFRLVTARELQFGKPVAEEDVAEHGRWRRSPALEEGGRNYQVQGREQGGGDPEVRDKEGSVKTGRRGYVWEWWWKEGRWAG